MPRPELSFNVEYQKYFDMPAGREHYRLLETLVADKKGVVVDVGTLFGSSALALSSNPDVEVWTYDIVDHIPKNASLMRSVPNIVFYIKDGIQAIPDFVKKTDLILLDIDPHDGIQEKAFFDALVAAGYRGVVICDDIHLNDAMKAWWEQIEQEKEDITVEGHASGTGRVIFS